MAADLSVAGENSITRRGTIRFILDGRTMELDGIDPTRTVLQFLREDLGRTGTKEGCAEGDCGACTVVINDLDASGARLQSRAVNACIQFLPTLDGKELLTVESLSSDSEELHPAQRAMIDCHGSQCGFCTPGFVMSLFALYKTSADPGRRDIDEALAGNLCRCTGYRPIVDAARKMYSLGGAQDDWRFQKAGNVSSEAELQRVTALHQLADDRPLCVRSGDRRFFSPRSLGELAALVAENPDATLVAGATDVGLWVTKQHRELDTLIYLGNVPELLGVARTGTHLEIGAAVTLSDAMAAILRDFPQLEELFVRFASPPIRNAGTLGGNVANASPIGDSMPALLALGATVVLRGGSETREIELADYYLAYQETALRRGEFLEKVCLPLPVDNQFLASYKISKRFDQDISAACAAFSLRIGDDGKVTALTAGFGGMAAIPSRARHCESAVLGNEWNEETLATAMKALEQDFDPLSDMRSTASYRMNVSKNLLRRFYLETTRQIDTSVYNYGR